MCWTRTGLWALGWLWVMTASLGAQSRPILCDGPSNRINAVTVSGYRTATVDFVATGGGLDPNPLLSTTVNVGGATGSCLIAHFSAIGAPQDNFIVFQARVDGSPMQGHLPSFNGFATPVVVDPEETDKNLPRMVAYNFFQRVEPGAHRVEIFFAGCCSANPNAQSGTVGSPVLTLEYR